MRGTVSGLGPKVKTDSLVFSEAKRRSALLPIIKLNN
ncbi:hypothetical protein X474_04580 [Dethiosulfatarculus sandiegensis]|uniref:Uncharacterized protein n=1 Tax=Dethiosulfatarculus sandiegensis TaxID=1429043 RepID=A0A0D2HY05_9BACT|nr:hypothetical protein X474_04580 [Dethiosulfatarculus sandiegensis]